MALDCEDCKEVLKKIMKPLMDATADKKLAPPIMLAIDRACTYVLRVVDRPCLHVCIYGPYPFLSRRLILREC
jgi:hypothetical protein